MLLFGVTLSANQVDVWRIDLAGQEHAIHRCRSLLSQDEIQRADRFYFERHRRRFSVARAAMREILGWYSGAAPQELVFSYGMKGKPELSGQPDGCAIRFNLSHSDEVAVLAVARSLTVGIDIEFVDPKVATEAIADRFFSAREAGLLRALPPEVRAEAFFSCWTRKEAYIKALGEGLSVPLDSFEVAFGPGTPAALLSARVDPAEVKRWSMYDVEAGQGYKAALVIEGNGHILRHLPWRSEALRGPHALGPQLLA
jgi:4'-phosphopantetheinyl transferase